MHFHAPSSDVLRQRVLCNKTSSRGRLIGQYRFCAINCNCTKQFFAISCNCTKWILCNKASLQKNPTTFAPNCIYKHILHGTSCVFVSDRRKYNVVFNLESLESVTVVQSFIKTNFSVTVQETVIQQTVVSFSDEAF